MKDEHIINILDRSSLAGLSASELESVRAHLTGCDDCRRAFEAARISQVLLKERSAEEIEPPPFFQTRVMAAWRERQRARETWPFRRIWQATGAMVSSMAAAVAALAVLTIFAPSPTPEPPEAYSALGRYGAEEVILAQGDPAYDDLTDEQVLSAIYAADEEAVK